MNKKILTVMAISVLILGFAGKVIYADDEAMERILITLNPGEEKKFTDADDQRAYLVRCLTPQPPALPVCEIRKTHEYSAGHIDPNDPGRPLPGGRFGQPGGRVHRTIGGYSRDCYYLCVGNKVATDYRGTNLDSVIEKANALIKEGKCSAADPAPGDDTYYPEYGTTATHYYAKPRWVPYKDEQNCE